MNRTNSILGAILAVQLGLIAVVYMSKSDASVATLEPILTVDAADVTKVEVYGAIDKSESESKGDGPQIVLDRGSGTWQLASHFDYPANATKVDELVAKVTGMKAREPISTSAANHRKFGVSDDSAKRRIIIHRKVGEPIEVYVGSGAGQRQTAVRIKGQEKVYGATGVTAAGISTTPTAWVESRYFSLVGGAASMTIRNQHGEFELRREAGDKPWQRYAGDAEVPVPEGKQLDSSRVTGLVNKLANISLVEPADPATPLEQPTALVRFKAIGGDKDHTLAIREEGEQKDGRFVVKVDDQAPVWVSELSAADFVNLKGEDLYRDPPKEGDAPPPPAPGAGMQGLPPEILRQLQQQGVAPQ